MPIRIYDAARGEDVEVSLQLAEGIEETPEIRAYLDECERILDDHLNPDGQSAKEYPRGYPPHWGAVSPALVPLTSSFVYHKKPRAIGTTDEAINPPLIGVKDTDALCPPMDPAAYAKWIGDNREALGMTTPTIDAIRRQIREMKQRGSKPVKILMTTDCFEAIYEEARHHIGLIDFQAPAWPRYSLLGLPIDIVENGSIDAPDWQIHVTPN